MLHKLIGRYKANHPIAEIVLSAVSAAAMHKAVPLYYGNCRVLVNYFYMVLHKICCMGMTVLD